jgi:hypothetical protein
MTERIFNALHTQTFDPSFVHLGHNVRAICWIVPKKYLLLLDQTIFLHFRSVLALQIS